jgi:HEAT repeat protein
MVFETIKNQINSSNSLVSASAISAISEFPTEEVFEILFNKIGEDNETVRKNAIAGICRYPKLVSQRLITSLTSQNWVERNSALSCISNIIDGGYSEIEEFIVPLTELCEDKNSIVQAYALTTLAKVYQCYQKNKKV